jgi:elongation factor P
MATYDTSDIRKGLKVMMDGSPWTVVEFQFVKPGKGAAFTRTKFKNLLTGNVVERNIRSGEKLESADVEVKSMQYLYKDGDSYHFMDTESYEQMHISAEALGDSVNYIMPDATIAVEFYGSEPVGIELPPTVDLKVVDTAPGIKGATASNQIKPATLETGLVVQVPPFVNEGDKVRVNTETGEYQSRV